MFGLFECIILYEKGELNDTETLELFSQLIKRGLAWTLQGHYGRTAQDFIGAGYLSREGNIIYDPSKMEMETNVDNIRKI